MDLSDLSLSSDEDDQITTSNLSLIPKVESDNEDIHLQTSTRKSINETDYPSLEKYTDAVQCVKVRSESAQVSSLSAYSINKGSISNTPLSADNASLKTSQSTLSFTSTDATFGSSSFDSLSTGDEQLNDFEATSEKCESQDISKSVPDRGLFMSNIVSEAPSTTSFDSTDQSQMTDIVLTSADGASLAFNKALDFCKSSSNTEATVLPFSESVPSNNARDEGTSGFFLDSGATGSFCDCSCSLRCDCPTKNKSVRRKIKTEPSISSATDSDIEETSNKCKYQDISKSKLGMESLRPAIVSKAISTISFTGIDSTNQSQMTEYGLTGAAGTSLASNKTSDFYGSSSKIESAVLPLPGNVPSNNNRDEETSGFFSDYCVTRGVCNRNQQSCCLTEDKSVRRKVKTESSTLIETDSLPSKSYASSWPSNASEDKSVVRTVKTGSSTLFETDSLPRTSYASSAPSNASNIGRSLLKLSKSMEQTSYQAEKGIYESFSRIGGVKYYSPTPWANEIFGFCQQATNNAIQASQRPVAEDLMKGVHDFFQNNPVHAESDLSWEESKEKILTSKYFCDDFSQRHGLISYDELMANYGIDTSLRIRKHWSIRELCKKYIESSISEQNFIDYYKRQVGDMGTILVNILESSYPEYLSDNVYRQMSVIGLGISHQMILELYNKLTKEGASFMSILDEWKPSSADMALCRKLPSRSENSSLVPQRFTPENQSALCTDLETLIRTQRDYLLTSEGNAPKGEEFTIEASQTQSKGPKAASNVFHELDSSVFEAENEPVRTTEKSQSRDEQSASKDGLNMSTEDLDSKIDEIGSSEE